jgi:acetyl-CoA synthetase
MTELDQFLAARDSLLAARTDYDKAYRSFTWPKLEKFNWARDYFDAFARDNDNAALWLVNEDGSEVRLTFEQMSQRSNRVANYLRAHGVKTGDVMLVMLGNVVPLWETMLATIKLGAIMVPATSLLTAADVRDRIHRGNVRHVIVENAEVSKFASFDSLVGRFVVGGDHAGWTRFEQSAEQSDQFEDVIHDAHAPFLRYFTSGTTSKPKLVEHSQQSYPVGHLSTMYWNGLQPGDVHWSLSSTGWAKHAYSSVFAPWNAGSCVFALNQSKFDAKRILTLLSTRPIDSFCAPPTVWRMLIQEDLSTYKPSQLREVAGAGEPLNPEVIEQVRRAWDLTVRDGYGQTETTLQIANAPGQRVKPGSVGRPLPGFTIELLDVDGHPSSQGEIAILLGTRPTGVLNAYAGDAAKTHEALGGAHYRTGDVASRDDDGYITFIGRADDIFKSSDYRMSPFELESVLLEHPDVAEAAIVPSPDPQRLSVPKAFITLRSGAAPEPQVALSILRFSRDQLAAFKRVRRLEFAELPKTVSGKIRRVELRQLEAARELSARRVNEFWEEDFPELKASSNC